MVSTVTISTISVIATSSLAIQAGIVVTLFLISMLVIKNISEGSSNTNRRLGKWLYIGITPLLIGFITIVGVKVIELIGR